ncbi:RsiV family protein [Oscillibacter sp.]|uniref:RsiV family protein n=1 Tax=Oscillibacter sp. TaxID=1945593 RepID=UPI001B503720|nr:RsiV family protein [Oscillibacter sp.]MBP3508807.1 DUF3298 domain-containing protein [Oscillibacter sp.]
MNEFKEAKQAYDNVPVPAELDQRVRAGIRQGKARRARQAWGKRLGTVAACFVVVVGALNVSPTMASAAADIPVLGGLFRVLTVRSFTDENSDRTLEVEQPAVEGCDALAQRVNREIQAIVDEKTAEGEQLIAEYKDAYFATGGTQEEWERHDNTASVTYDIKSQTDTTVSFVVNSSVSIANAYQEQFYYNLDLTADKELTLADLLGEDWVTICNDSIRAQMAASENADMFFTEDQGGFTTVDEMTNFYIDQSGDPVVVFPKYTVAPGAMGEVEFTISK